MPEPAAITPPPASTHPYAVRFELTLGSDLELTLIENEARVAFSESNVLVFKKLRDLPLNKTSVSLDLEAFPLPADAQRAGQLLAFSLMWLAASKRITIGFAKWTGGLPFAVRDRTRSDGVTCHAEGRALFRLDPAEVSAEVASAYDKGIIQPDALLTSMQFFASARLESSEIARFVGVVTALEALAEQQEYGSDVELVLKELAAQMQKVSSLPNDVRSSLAGRIRELTRESVRKAIKRLVKAHIDNKDTFEFVEESYDVRCKILHEGKRVENLSERTYRLEGVMRDIYAARTGLTLSR